MSNFSFRLHYKTELLFRYTNCTRVCQLESPLLTFFSSLFFFKLDGCITFDLIKWQIYNKQNGRSVESTKMYSTHFKIQKITRRKTADP